MLRQSVRNAVAASAMGARRFEATHGLRRWSLRGLLDQVNPKVPSVDRAAEICDALGLEFYVGPPRGAGEGSPVPLGGLEESTRSLVGLTTRAGGNPIPKDLWPVLAVRYGDVPVAGRDDVPAGDRPVDVIEIETPAGARRIALDEQAVGLFWFRRNWLWQRAIDPVRCIVMRVRGSSMDPTLPDGCWIVVDKSRNELAEEGVFVARTDEGIVARRATRNKGGGWRMEADNPSWEDRLWPSGATPIGRVVGMTRLFV